jgi:hypothetical protein
MLSKADLDCHRRATGSPSRCTRCAKISAGLITRKLAPIVPKAGVWLRSSVSRSTLPRSKWWMAEGKGAGASSAVPRFSVRGESSGVRRSRCGADVWSWWANNRLDIDLDRAESTLKSEDHSRLSGGEAMAELNQPRPHIPPAATRISRCLSALFMTHWSMGESACRDVSAR